MDDKCTGRFRMNRNDVKNKSLVLSVRFKLYVAIKFRLRILLVAKLILSKNWRRLFVVDVALYIIFLLVFIEEQGNYFMEDVDVEISFYFYRGAFIIRR